jgi:hypothetical protein
MKHVLATVLGMGLLIFLALVLAAGVQFPFVFLTALVLAAAWILGSIAMEAIGKL